MQKLLLTLSALAALSLSARNYCDLPKVKLIHDGWSFQYTTYNPKVAPHKSEITTSFIRNNIALLENSVPGNGIVIRFVAPAANCEGKAVNINSIFGGRKIKYEYFKEDIENIQNTEFKKFTDNFLGLTVSPGNVDWFDDAAWQTVCHNNNVMARIAKECKLVGLKLDIEEYHSNSMWQFKADLGRTHAETMAKVRQRGREFGKALFSAFPDAHLLCYWWLSLARHKNDRFQPERSEYMVAPFVNGMYDVMPPTITIHEGNEACAYRANNAIEFYHLSVDMHKVFPRFLDPVNWSKYRNQTKLAPGLYVDPHFATGNGFWKNQLQPDLKALGGAKLLKRNLLQAMEVADTYVWMWHERHVWYPSNHPAKPILISSVAPNLKDDMEVILNPEKHAKARIAAKKINNMVVNGDFAKMPEGKQQIANFAHWFNGKGKFQRKEINGNPVAAAIGVESGCIYQSRPAKAGELFLVRCSASNLDPAKRNSASITVNWIEPNGERFADYSNRIYHFRKLKDGKDTVEFTIAAPENAKRIELMLGVGNLGPEDEVYFDDLELYRIVD